MVDGEGLEPVFAALETVPRVELDERERIRQAADERAQLPEQILHALRAVHGQARPVPSAQGEGLQHPGEAEKMVAVEVREEDLLQVGQTDDRALELALRPLGAIEEQPLAAAPQQERGGRPLGRRHRRRGAEEKEVEIHAGRF